MTEDPSAKKPAPMDIEVVKTSKGGWLKEVASYYKNRQPFVLDDDAKIGVDPRQDSLLRMGLRAVLSAREWAGVFVSLGIAGVGLWVLVMTVVDPEPFSKIVAALVTGAILFGTGGMMAVRILTNVKPPTIVVSKTGGFEIRWD